MNTSAASATKTTVFCWDNFPITGNVLPSFLKKKDKPLESKINAFVIGLMQTIATFTLVIPTITFTVELICALFKKKSNVDEKKAKPNSSVSLIEKKGSISETVKKQGDSSSSGCMTPSPIDNSKNSTQKNNQIDEQKGRKDIAAEKLLKIENGKKNFIGSCLYSGMILANYAFSMYLISHKTLRVIPGFLSIVPITIPFIWDQYKYHLANSKEGYESLMTKIGAKIV